MERIVIACYKPLKGKGTELLKLVEEHWERLNKLRLVSERRPVIAEAEDGTILEIFGWKSREAIESAHQTPEVQEMWEQFSRVCEFIPAGQVPEINNLFSEFRPAD